MNRQIESITKFRVGPFNVRVWRKADTLVEADAHDMRDFLDVAGFDEAEIADLIATRPNVAAVEVTNDFGNGVIIYPDWP
jgi:hypothetical protein